jgi:hypothetical protein
MAGESEEIEIRYTADTSDLKRKGAGLGGVLSAPFDKAGKATKGAADQTKQYEAGLEAAKQAAEGFGGATGGAAGMVEKFTRSAAQAGRALGPMGAAGVVAGLALAGLGMAAFSVVEAQTAAIRTTIEWAKELDEAGSNAVPGATAAVLDFDRTLRASTQTGKELAVLVGGDLIEAGQDYADVALLMAVATRRVWQETDFLRDGLTTAFAPLQTWNDAIGHSDKVTTALGLAFPGLREEVEALKASFDDSTFAIDINKRAMGDMMGLSGALEAAQRRARIAASDFAQAERDAAAALREAEKAAQEKEREDKRRAEEALAAWQMRRAWSVEVQAMADAEAEAEVRAYQRGVDAAHRAAAEVRQIRIERRDAAISIASQQFDAIESLARSAANAAANREDLTDQQKKKRVMAAYAVQQSAAVAGVAIDAAQAIMAMTAFYAGFLGPGAPAAAFATVAPMAAAQTVAIMSQPPPQFPMGGMVRDRAAGDHVMVSAQPDEAILNGRGVAAAGGPSAIEALNAGASTAAQPIQLLMDGEVLGEWLASPNGERVLMSIVRRNLPRGAF